ncbi:MAG: glycine reductase [Acidobacteria bacterium]|nr:glycine reductase [Acidobacteriota bacterium]
MRLELGTFEVREVVLGPSTELVHNRLQINKDEVISLILEDSTFTAADVEIVRPGENARIVHVLDTIEPRRKVAGPGGVFPGLLSPMDTVGDGRTHRLAGVAVMETAEVPWGQKGGLLMVREGIVDMTGLAAEYSPFSKTINVVLIMALRPDCSDDEYDQSLRLAGLKVSEYVARTTIDQAADEYRTYDLETNVQSLPRVIYVHQVQSQGTFSRTFFYGKHLDDLMPTLVHPNEMMDGALVSGNNVGQSMKTPTYLHCNDPVVQELYDGHGTDWNFVGVILSRGHFYGIHEKQRSAHQVAKLARMLRAEGAIVTWEGGGNSIIEAMLTVQALERAGIKTTIISYELGGSDGKGSPILLHSVPEADAIVSCGTYERPVALPEVQRVVGGKHVRINPAMGGVYLPANEPLQFDMSLEMYCSVNQTGFGRLRCIGY